jgi:hypothetical protein
MIGLVKVVFTTRVSQPQCRIGSGRIPGLSPVQSRWWPNMKSHACIVGLFVLVALLPGQSSAQTQDSAPASTRASATTAAVKSQSKAVGNGSSVTRPPSAPKSARQMALSGTSRKSTPPPPPSRRSRSAKNAKSTVQGTELDPHGRIDMAGKAVPFYPTARGAAATAKGQATAYRAGHRAKTNN